MTKDELERQAAALVEANPAYICALCIPLGEEPLFDLGGKTRVVSASTIKTPILCTALEQVREGKLSLEQPVKVDREVILEDSEFFDLGPGTFPLWELLYWMIVTSDNTCTNVLIDLLGMDTINAWCAAHGLENSRVERKMLDWKAIEEGRNNYTSPWDQYKLFAALYCREILTPELCGVAWDILLRQRSTDQFLRYISDDVQVAHKTGGLDYLNHDCGIFCLPEHPYYLGVFVSNTPKIEGDSRVVGQLSRLAYDYMKGRC